MPGTISLCQNPHQGLCTEDCPDRTTCRKQRIPFLIPAIVIHYRLGKVYPEEYINEVVQMKVELENSVGHQGGTKMDVINGINLKINLL